MSKRTVLDTFALVVLHSTVLGSHFNHSNETFSIFAMNSGDFNSTSDYASTNGPFDSTRSHHHGERQTSSRPGQETSTPHQHKHVVLVSALKERNDTGNETLGEFLMRRTFSNSTVTLTAEDVSRCANGFIQLSVHPGVSLHYSHRAGIEASGGLLCWVRLLHTGDEAMKIFIVPGYQTCVHGNAVLVSQTGRLDNWTWSGCEGPRDRLGFLLSESGGVGIGLRITNHSGDYSVTLDVRLLGEEDVHELHRKPLVGILTSRLGILQSLSWGDWSSEGYVSHTYYIFFHLPVPAKKRTMISIVYLHATFVMYPHRNNFGLFPSFDIETEPQYGVEHIPLGTHVYTEDLKLLNRQDTSSLGFKLLFSYHSLSALPTRAADGLWDCSVPHWGHWAPHLRCNLVRECGDGRDEAGCGYDRCGRDGDGFVLAGRCYSLRQVLRPVPVSAFYDVCRGVQGVPASFPHRHVLGRLSAFLWSHIYLGVWVGAFNAQPGLPSYYNFALQWSDSTIMYHMLNLSDYEIVPNICTYLWFTKDDYEIVFSNCAVNRTSRFLCEITDGDTPNYESSSSQEKKVAPTLPVPNTTFDINQTFVACPAGHVTYSFLSCDTESGCLSRDAMGEYVNREEAWDVPSPTWCPAPTVPPPPAFRCRLGNQRVAYSLLCDHRPHCLDGSDENFCHFPPCPAGHVRCGESYECTSISHLCDKVVHCSNGADEYGCFHNHYKRRSHPAALPPAVVDITNNRITLTKSWSAICPESHFKCTEKGYCFPVYMRCNGVNDCPGHEDELGCEDLQCPGLYRCRGSAICLHSRHLCDGERQCPQSEDELFCLLRESQCFPHCQCYGLSLICKEAEGMTGDGAGLAERLQDAFGEDDSRDIKLQKWLQHVRYLHAGGSGLGLGHVAGLTMLVHLGLPRCRLSRLHAARLPNLHSLHLARNRLSDVTWDQLSGLPHLRALSLAGNPLSRAFFALAAGPSPPPPDLLALDLSGIPLPGLVLRSFVRFPNLEKLNLSHCDIDGIRRDDLGTLRKLAVLDLSGSPVRYFPQDVFTDVTALRDLKTDNPRLCCPAVFPAQGGGGSCHAPSMELVSCETLLRSSAFRLILAIFSTLAITGNVFSFVARFFLTKFDKQYGYIVFIMHLCVSDLLMGLYLAIIGVADLMYGDEYAAKDVVWRTSSTCSVAGFLCLLSSEVSAFIICLITLDRCLVFRFPFRKIRFSMLSATAALAVAWMVGFVLATVPLLPVTSHWEFYSQTALCFPLPFQSHLAGRGYSFGVVILANLLLFVLIAAGQAYIYLTVRSQAGPSPARSSRDVQVARRLVAVALSDFCCWSPVGTAGILALGGVPVPQQLNLVVAVSVLPLNSALNPFLYSLSVVLQHRRQRREARFMQQLDALK